MLIKADILNEYSSGRQETKDAKEWHDLMVLQSLISFDILTSTSSGKREEFLVGQSGVSILIPPFSFFYLSLLMNIYKEGETERSLITQIGSIQN